MTALWNKIQIIGTMGNEFIHFCGKGAELKIMRSMSKFSNVRDLKKGGGVTQGYKYHTVSGLSCRFGPKFRH